MVAGFRGLKIPILRAHCALIQHAISTRVYAVIDNSSTPNEPYLYILDMVPRLRYNSCTWHALSVSPCLTVLIHVRGHS